MNIWPGVVTFARGSLQESIMDDMYDFIIRSRRDVILGTLDNMVDFGIWLMVWYELRNIHRRKIKDGIVTPVCAGMEDE